MKQRLTILAIPLVWIGLAAFEATAVDAKPVAPMLQVPLAVRKLAHEYCIQCHDAANEKGDLNLEAHLPIIVAGGAAGGMKGGRHIAYDKPTPLANLHLTLLDKVGVERDSFGDSDGKVDALFEPLSI